MNILRHFLRVTLIVAGVLLLMVINDLINPHREIEVVIDPAFIVYPKDDIGNPENSAYVVEVAFNLGIDTSEVTQEQFNQRYGTSQK